MIRPTITRLAIWSTAALTVSCAHRINTSAYSPEIQDGLARVRAATASFRSLASAVAAGYTGDVPSCLAHGEDGAMGFHHMNRAYVDDRIEIERPEILVYERHPDGRYTLNGVEYIIPYSVWSRDSTPPKVFGLDLKHADRLQLWYLHMWTWKENPSGLFADWNPGVHCLEG